MPENIKFTDPAVSAKYNCESPVDKQVRLITHNHQGMLSNITLPIADELYRQQSNLLSPKAAISAKSDAGKEKDKNL